MLNTGGTCSTTTGVAPQLFTAAINFLAATQCFTAERSYEPTLYTKDYDEFDFIIVGGGSAGSVVASRLSEITDWKILLLEAGSEPPMESDIPYLWATLFNTTYDWNYYTQNDGVRHKAIKGGSAYWPRGKMLGGSSSMNAMFYVRGRDHDFQMWKDAGNPSWTPENVNRYFKKAESFQNFELLKDADIRNTYGLHGPQVVNVYNSTYRDITEKILESCDSMGLKRVNDINSAKFGGLGLSGYFSSIAANGRRYSTYRSYLEPIKDRKNLNILTNAFVTKILINENHQAYGVEVNIFGKNKIFYANKEVIVSAGTINTPQLLMLSGVGPEKHLLSKNISCLVNLPGVGQNLQDHNNIPIVFSGDEPGHANQAETYFEIAKYMYNRSGFLAQHSFSDVTTFFSSHQNRDYPDFQTHLMIVWKGSQQNNYLFSVFLDDIYKSFVEINKNKALYVFHLHILHPFSTGSIHLKTSNPYDHPIINANYFGDSKDSEAIVDGIKILTNIVNTTYFRSINASVLRVNIPECNQYKFESDSYWKCYASSTCMTVFHPVGTSKMGPNPKDAVVNNFLKVHGVRGLRVIDASIMPTITSGNTNAPTIMIGEMGSDMIKAEYILDED